MASASLYDVSSFVYFLIEIRHMNINDNNNTYCVVFEVLTTVVMKSCFQGYNAV
jgi:hypothetical protein